MIIHTQYMPYVFLFVYYFLYIKYNIIEILSFSEHVSCTLYTMFAGAAVSWSLPPLIYGYKIGSLALMVKFDLRLFCQKSHPHFHIYSTHTHMRTRCSCAVYVYISDTLCM